MGRLCWQYWLFLLDPESKTEMLARFRAWQTLQYFLLKELIIRNLLPDRSVFNFNSRYSSIYMSEVRPHTQICIGTQFNPGPITKFLSYLTRLMSDRCFTSLHLSVCMLLVAFRKLLDRYWIFLVYLWLVYSNLPWPSGPLWIALLYKTQF